MTSVSRLWRRFRSARMFEVHDVDLLERPTSRSVRIPAPRPGVEIRRIARDEPSWWESEVPPEYARYVPQFLARADVGHAALVDREFAGWVWLSRVTFRDAWSGLRVRVRPGEAYSHSLWVAEEHRPRGIAGALVAVMLSELGEDTTMERIYGWVDSDNRQSQMLLRMSGFSQVQKVKRMGTIGVGWQLPFSARPRQGPLTRSRRPAGPAAGVEPA